ncbi:MAG: oxidoreductase [Bacteroidetes bacterium]|nr:MAG: oxidoreductase [Bacteroidota bacterium]
MELLSTFIFSIVSFSLVAQPLRVGVAGLSHDHIRGLLHQFQEGEVVILGIAESNQDLVQEYKKNYHLPDSLFYHNLSAMLEKIKPDFVLAYNPIADHLAVVEACAPKGISVMVEKPLATTNQQAEKMKELVNKYHIKLLTNYETTWYPSNQQVFDLAGEGRLGSIRKMVIHSGHQGPKEIGCSPYFLSWLTDSVKNGGGAVMDFGCYGANLMTWMMQGKAPVSVMAVTRHIKPGIYSKVDDDATIILEYPSATGIIEASWNWPFGIKDMEVFGEKSYLHALNSTDVEGRDTTNYKKLPAYQSKYKDNIAYLRAVIDGKANSTNDLSSLENNLIVVRILSAARESARTGKKIVL